MMLPMIVAAIALGKSFRLDTMAPQQFIFVEGEIQTNKVVIEDPFTRSEYKMVESASDINDFLSMEGELSLFLKSNKISISGTGEYLTKKIDRTKTVEILLKVNTQQKIETLPTYVALQPGWESSTLGSHFIRSIVYGGQLLVTYQMTSDNSENIEEIKAVVNANLETSGSVNLEVKGKLEKISKDLTGKCETRIHAYYTGGIFAQPTDLESAFQLMEDFPEKFAEYTQQEGRGIPVQFDLEHLSTLSSKFTHEVKDKTRNEILDEAIDKYDDVLFAYKESKDWFPESGEKLERTVQLFKQKMIEAKEALEAAIGNLNMSKSFDVHHFDPAFLKYAHDGINIPNRYTRELNALKNAEKHFVPEWYPYTRAVNDYVHWGNVNCSLPSPDPIIIGAAASSPLGFGSGSDIQCLGIKPSLIKARLGPETKRSAINGLTYQSPSFQGKQAGDQTPRPLLCARCLLENATAIITVPAKRHCPGGTKLEYEGFLATGTEAVTDPICIDKNPVHQHKDIVVRTDATANSIMPLRMMCPNCRYADENVHYVPCVVCSR